MTVTRTVIAANKYAVLCQCQNGGRGRRGFLGLLLAGMAHAE